jgi:SRSO17 transposase/GNAT superfamily N-acetyltransferase
LQLSVNPQKHKRERQMTTSLFPNFPIAGTVRDLQPIEIRMVDHSPLERLWDELVSRHHYLGHRKMLGERLKYLAFSGGRPVAALGFRSAALKMECRDRFIGWSAEQRAKHLSRVANNNRFLILPEVRVKNLGSYLLARVIRQLQPDWHLVYGRELLLLETFVDPRWFQGTIYKAANWVHVGTTMGFGRQGPSYRYHGHAKEVYLYPLRRDFRRIIECTQRPPKPSKPSKQGDWYLMMLTGKDWNPDLVAQTNLAVEEVQGLAGSLLEFHRQFHDCFQREEQRVMSLVYMKGLASDLEAKSAEPIALRYLDQKGVRNMQHFLSTGTWENVKVEKKQQILLGAKISETEDDMFTMDNSEFPKKGRESAGVARQYCGNLGKVENCQSGVFLGYAGQKGYGLLSAKLYVPEKWFGEEYAERRAKCHFPEDLPYQAKPEIALALLQQAKATGAFSGRWVGCDSTFGNDPAFLDAVGEEHLYFAAVRSNTRVWLERPGIGIPPYKGRGPRPKKERPLTDPVPVSEIAHAPTLSWQTVSMGEGAKGPIFANVARIRVIEQRMSRPGKECWLFLRQSMDGETKYALSNAPEDIPMEELIRAAGMRWSIEQLFQEGKSHLGMDHYEIRSYPGWHRHMCLVFLVMHFLLTVRLELGQKKLDHASTGQTPAFGCSGG